MRLVLRLIAYMMIVGLDFVYGEGFEMFQRAYDVRGKVGEEFNDEIAYRIGRATAQTLGAKSVILGFDSREVLPDWPRQPLLSTMLALTFWKLVLLVLKKCIQQL